MPRLLALGTACALFLGTVAPVLAQGCPATLQLSDRGSQLHIDIAYAADATESGVRLGPNFAIFQDGNPPVAIPTRVQAAPSETSRLLVAALGSREQVLLSRAGIDYGDFRKGLREATTGISPAPFRQAESEGQSLGLARIMLSEGAPDRQSWLVPDSTDGHVSQWHLAADSDEDVWVSCGYGRTNLLLSQRLPASVTWCSVSATADAAGGPSLACGTR